MAIDEKISYNGQGSLGRKNIPSFPHPPLQNNIISDFLSIIELYITVPPFLSSILTASHNPPKRSFSLPQKQTINALSKTYSKQKVNFPSNSQPLQT